MTFSRDGPFWNPVFEAYYSVCEITLPSSSSLIDVIRKVYICEEFCVFLLFESSRVTAYALIAAIVICL
jgi:hypothetical protein